jgi:hypothetical protein
MQALLVVFLNERKRDPGGVKFLARADPEVPEALRGDIQIYDTSSGEWHD